MTPDRFKHYSLSPLIDDDHIEIFKIVDDIIATVKIHLLVSEVEINKLIDTIHLHFVNESNIMKSCNYPHIKIHDFSHNTLLNKIKAIFEKQNWNCYVISDFEELFVSHIDHDDRQFFDWKTRTCV